MISKTFNRYIWLLNILLQRGDLTFEEIRLRWKNSHLSDGKPLALRTFHVHRAAIAELFGVEVKCNPSTYKYYLSKPEVFRNDRMMKWLLNSFTISNMIEAGHNMTDRILFEDIPRGTEFIQTIVDAMQQNKVLNIEYYQFGKDAIRKRFEFHPYAMKVYRQRWYLVGVIPGKEIIRKLSVDRIVQIWVCGKRFTYPGNFDAKKYFQDCVGIFVNEDRKPQKVQIKVYDRAIDYLRSLPLHQSQKEVEAKYGEYSVFEYRLSLTPELSTQLLSLGNKVEVLEPKELRDDMKKQLQDALYRYF